MSQELLNHGVINKPAHIEIAEFLYNEAELLDGKKYAEWLDIVTEDIRYKMPVRTYRMRDEKLDDGNNKTAYLDENLASLRTRVAILEKFTHAEDPPSFSRHFVTNIRIRPRQHATEYEVMSNILVYIVRGTQLTPVFLSGERHDILRRTDGRLRLAERTVLIDSSVIGTMNMTVFL